MDHESLYADVEMFVYHIAEWIKLGIETAGVLVVAWGMIISLWLYGRTIFTPGENDYAALRRRLAKYLIIALEFQLAADVLSTAIAPGWDEIGKLAVIAGIRTVLNYFLEKELENAEVEGEAS